MHAPVDKPERRQNAFRHKLAILNARGISIPKDARILDYGCGAGAMVSALVAEGYVNSFGFDVDNYLDPGADPARFRFSADGSLPYEDSSFDLVLSDQVFEHVRDQELAWRELARVMKPGAVSIHMFPPRWRIIEPHMYVPFGSMIGSEGYFYVWACLGIRNEFQKGMSARETARKNAEFFRTGINYISSVEFRRHWSRAGLEGSFCEPEYLATSDRRLFRRLAPIARALPPVRVALREFWAKNTIVTKPAKAAASAA